MITVKLGLITALMTCAISSPLLAKDLVIGKQDLDPTTAQKMFGEMATSLSKVLGVNVTTKAYRFPSQIDADVQAGKVDITIDTAFNKAFTDTKRVMEPVVNIWKKGVEYHQGCLVTLPGKTADLKALKGKKIVFEEPFSTGSFAMPFVMLTKYVQSGDIHIITAEEAKKAGGSTAMDGYKNYKLGAGQVGLVLSGDDEKTPNFLKLSDDFALAGMACLTAEELKLNIIEKSIKTPRTVVSLHKDMDAETKKKIVAWFSGLTKDSPELKPLKGSAAKELTAEQKKMTDDALNAFAGALAFVNSNIAQK